MIAALAFLSCVLAFPTDDCPDVWATRAPRDEIRPEFEIDPRGGREGAPALVIAHDEREGLDGWYERAFPVEGERTYRFAAWRKCEGVAEPRRSALVRIVWQGEDGKAVAPADPNDPHGRAIWVAEPEHPRDTAVDGEGWAMVTGTYAAPPGAKVAVVELHLQWAPGGKVAWSGVILEAAEPPAPRKVRLAAVHYKPTGKSARENCEEFAPLIAEAARQKADLVVLGETITSVGVPGEPQELAQPVPGPATDFFGSLAKQHGTHIVFSLLERDRHLVYNAAVLIGPEGTILGKYRKTCLPHGEAEKGIAPGKDYPVFNASFGKVGMMICYDGFFPEVARALADAGAEVIAWPVYGCDPLLARARACENRVYVVSSTFMGPESGWMRTAVYDPFGTPVAEAEGWGTVVVSEVDLNRPSMGPYNLGEFGAMVPRHRPAGR